MTPETLSTTMRYQSSADLESGSCQIRGRSWKASVRLIGLMKDFDNSSVHNCLGDFNHENGVGNRELYTFRLRFSQWAARLIVN